ncbi:hypothetical protein EDB85DRAFT_2278944 [Lactarius pseudohatsudake]|nr:hypothetical protein EDB85DRAFT_2278944 [Lactarius pseudohatsudake]
MGMGSGRRGYGFRRVARVAEPVWVGTAGWHVTSAIQAAPNILAQSHIHYIAQPINIRQLCAGFGGGEVSQGVAHASAGHELFCVHVQRGREQERGRSGAGGRKQLRMLAHNTKLHMYGRHGRRRVGVEGLGPRASAAMSGEGTESAGRRWSEMVVHASARRETSHRSPPWSEMYRVQFVKAARECDILGNAQVTEKRSKIQVMDLRLQCDFEIGHDSSDGNEHQWSCSASGVDVQDRQAVVTWPGRPGSSESSESLPSPSGSLGSSSPGAGSSSSGSKLSPPQAQAALNIGDLIATQTRRLPDYGGHLCEVSSCAEACTTVSDHIQATDFMFIPDHAAPARGLIRSTLTRPLSPLTHIRKPMFRGGLRDTLRRFTPPKPCACLRRSWGSGYCICSHGSLIE